MSAKITFSLIFALIFLVASFSQPLIPCKDNIFCSLDGSKIYFFTDKLSNPLFAGLLTFLLVFLILIGLFSLIKTGKNK